MTKKECMARCVFVFDLFDSWRCCILNCYIHIVQYYGIVYMPKK